MLKKNDVKYQETQIGYMLIAAISVAIFTIVYLIYLIGFNLIFFTVILFLGFLLLLLSNMSTVMDESKIIIKLGIFLFAKEIRMVDIASYKINEKPLYNQWGIRPLPKGWVFSVAGFSSIVITLKNGEVYIIGTEQPKEMLAALTKLSQNKVSVK